MSVDFGALHDACVDAFGVGSDGTGDDARALYRPQRQAPVYVDGIFDNPWLRIDGVGEVPLTSREPRFSCRRADLPPDAAQGDSIDIKGACYRVRELRPDGQGWVVLDLEAA
ncbi:hypothetical protein FHP25_35890 [Vineibacter terrae]|uniref:Uncharacterized protein n=1 Tax=Vineibacter terrae TaxID=2586908 RepID=A0A5C8P9L4_9HYPH|nr:hypothetical protein [Vineibacter terrae]TXL70106.1 hypothetical protein FHP25_35890 [Vineibacter terrae]